MSHPKFTPADLREILREKFNINSSSNFVEYRSYNDQVFKFTDDSRNQNFIVKITNPDETETSSNNEFVAVSLFYTLLNSEGLLTQRFEGNSTYSANTRSHLIRLFTCLPGRLVGETDYQENLFKAIGCCLAKMANGFSKILKNQSYDNNILEQIELVKNRDYDWKLSNWVKQCKELMNKCDLPDENIASLVKNVMLEFENKMDDAADLEYGFIHGDFNHDNTLMKLVEGADKRLKDGNQTNTAMVISGILDLDDMSYDPVIFDLIISSAHWFIDVLALYDDRDLAARAVSLIIKAYKSGCTMNFDFQIFWVGFRSRICQLYVNAWYYMEKEPSNSEYYEEEFFPAKTVLEVLCDEEGSDELYKAILEVVGIEKSCT